MTGLARRGAWLVLRVCDKTQPMPDFHLVRLRINFWAAINNVSNQYI